MAMGSAKRSIMTLFSGSQDVESHRTRIVLAEKGILVDVIEVDRRDDIGSLEHLNPYNTLPILVDRDLALYESRIIMEYLDERFPHPPLLPVYPVARAQARLLMYRIEREWYPLVQTILLNEQKTIEETRKKLQNSFSEVTALFEQLPYFLGEEMSLVDCTVIPILWRLPQLGIELPKKQFRPLLNYAERLFERDTFQASLTETEREIRSNTP